MTKKLLTFLFLLSLLMMTGIASAQTGPEPDDDGDGIPNNVDSCPREAGPTDNRGCPIVPISTPEPVPPTPDDAGNNNNPTPETPSSVLPATPEPTPAPTLAPMPIDGACVVSPLGLFNVNVRAFPYEDADIVTILAVNELAPVLAVTQIMFLAEPEWVSENDVWYQIEHKGVIGWVAANVVRLGGDCSDFVIPTVFEADDVLNPINLPVPLVAGGVYVASGDLNGDGATEGGDHKGEIEILSLGDNGQIFPFRLANQPAGVVIDLLNANVLVNDGDGLPLVEIIVSSDKGTQPQAEIPNDLDIVVCANIADPEAPLTEEDCVIITSAASGAKADILIESNVILCVHTPEGILICQTAQTSDPNGVGECVPVGNTTFCVTDYLPTETCSYAEDGHVVCTAFSQVQIVPMNPTSPLPGLNLLHPDTEPIQVGLLLPAIQKVREA